LDLEEAIRREILVPIRCVRVKTNVDLTRVRFNGVDYRIRELEEALQLPGRDAMVAQTYCDHALGKRAVCFCVDVNHAKRMAEAFREAGVAAASVDGSMSAKKRDGLLADYEAGRVTVLCACDILTEGWDSPITEVLLMARPTLSKIVYVQQLGRGTRKAAGKDCLLVFDFIDNTARHAQALSVHALLKKSEYRPGALVAAPDSMLQAESDAFAAGGTPTAISGLHLYAAHLEVVDVFRWQDEAEGMVQASELAIELLVDDETIRDRVRRGDIRPDLSVPIGSREYHYFRRERIPELQKHYGVEPLTAENIRTAFLTFVSAADMAASYKPVLLLGMLECADGSGRVNIAELVAYFRDFYLKRLKEGLRVEAPKIRMANADALTDLQIERVMLGMPFEKFERKRFFRRVKDISMVRFDEALWRRLTAEDKAALRISALQQISIYFDRIT
jgi:hypothetical protein